MRYWLLVMCMVSMVYSQGFKPYSQTNPNLNLDSVLTGVRHVLVLMGENYQKELDAGNRNGYRDIVKTYLQYLGFESIGVTSQEKTEILNSSQSACDYISVSCNWNILDSHCIVLLFFQTCNDDKFEFSSVNPISDVDTLTEEMLYNYLLGKWKQLYSKNRTRYIPKNRLKLPALPTNWTEASLKQYFTTSSIDSVEGIYERIKMSADDEESKYKIAVVKTDNLSYNILYLGGANRPDDWQEGEIKAVLYKSAIPNYYKVDWYRLDKELDKDVLLQRTNEGLLEFKFTSSKSSYLKTFPVKW